MFSLSYLPYYRTSHLLTSPSFLPESHVSTEPEESFEEGKADTKQDEKVSYPAVSAGYFPYYRMHEELLGQPLTRGLNAEEKRPDNNGRDESEGDAESVSPRAVAKALPEIAQSGTGSADPTNLSTFSLPWGFAVAESDIEMCYVLLFHVLLVEVMHKEMQNLCKQ